MKFTWDLALKFDTVHDVHVPLRIIIHGCARNSAFCSSYQAAASAIVVGQSFHLRLRETDLRAGGIFLPNASCAQTRVHKRERQAARSRARSARIYCAPKRFRFKSLLISIQAPPPAVAHTYTRTPGHQK